MAIQKPKTLTAEVTSISASDASKERRWLDKEIAKQRSILSGATTEACALLDDVSCSHGEANALAGLKAVDPSRCSPYLTAANQYDQLAASFAAQLAAAQGMATACRRKYQLCLGGYPA